MQIIEKKITELKAYEKNPRKNDNAVAPVAESIKEFGFKVPIIIDKDNVIVAGHTRLKAAKKLGMKTVPCIVADDLTPDQIKAFRLADNSSAQIASWDLELLKDELIDLDFDMSLFGLEKEIKDIERIFAPEIIEDDVPEVDEKNIITKLGDMWQLGRHRLVCGDSTNAETVKKLMNGKTADMVFTDPPYGMNLDTDYSKMTGNGRKGKTYDKVIGDNEDFKDELITTIFDNFDYCNEIFLWGIDYYFDLIKDFKKGSLIVWDKTLQINGDAGYNSEFELCWTKTPHKKEVIHFNWFRYFGLQNQDIKTRQHPTQKPLQVISPYIKQYSKDEGIIVDVFGGSGSTLIACEQLNRSCYMMELDPKYVQVIIQRYIAFKGTSDDVYRINADGTKTKYKEVKNAERR